jgi:hypothetical protein
MSESEVAVASLPADIVGELVKHVNVKTLAKYVFHNKFQF